MKKQERSLIVLERWDGWESGRAREDVGKDKTGECWCYLVNKYNFLTGFTWGDRENDWTKRPWKLQYFLRVVRGTTDLKGMSTYLLWHCSVCRFSTVSLYCRWCTHFLGWLHLPLKRWKHPLSDWNSLRISTRGYWPWPASTWELNLA